MTFTFALERGGGIGKIHNYCHLAVALCCGRASGRGLIERGSQKPLCVTLWLLLLCCNSECTSITLYKMEGELVIYESLLSFRKNAQLKH